MAAQGSIRTTLRTPNGGTGALTPSLTRVPRTFAAASGSHAGSHTDERLPGSPNFSGRPTGAPPRSRTNPDEPGRPYGNLRVRRSSGIECFPGLRLYVHRVMGRHGIS